MFGFLKKKLKDAVSKFSSEAKEEVTEESELEEAKEVEEALEKDEKGFFSKLKDKITGDDSEEESEDDSEEEDKKAKEKAAKEKKAAEKKTKEKKAAEEKAKKEAEKKKAAEKAAKEKKAAEEKAKREAEKKAKEEAAAKAKAEKEAAEAEAKRLAEEEKKAAEEKARLEKEKKEAEEKAQAAQDEAEKKAAEAEAKRLAEEEKKAAEEAQRLAEEEAKAQEELRLAKEAQKAEEERLEAERIAEEKRQEEERLAAEVQAEEERKQAEEAQKAEEERLEAERIAEEEGEEEVEAEEEPVEESGGFFSRLKKRFLSSEKEEVQEEEDEADGDEEESDEEPDAQQDEAEEEHAQEEPTKEDEGSSIFSKITDTFTKKSLSDEKFEELFWELEVALLENNVALSVIEKIKEDLKTELVDKKHNRFDIEEIISKTLTKSIREILTFDKVDLLEKIKQKNNDGAPYIMCFVGINGSGKTTTIAKFITYLKENNLSSVLAASDTFRAAALEQLQTHADNLNTKLIKHDYGSDAAAVAYDAIQYAKQKDTNVVLIDTAGRLHSNTNLMAELKKVVRVSNTDFVMFIGDSLTGNDAVEQAEKYNELIGIDGIILSKADADDKGGATISTAYVTQKPILFLGTGQEYADLEEFDVDAVMEKLGFG